MNICKYRRGPHFLLAVLCAVTMTAHAQMAAPVAAMPVPAVMAGQIAAPAAMASAPQDSGKGLSNTPMASLPPEQSSANGDAVSAEKAGKTEKSENSEKTDAEESRPEVSSVKVRQSTFQRFVQQATGQALPVFGEQLFSAASGFAPVSGAPVPHNYILGPGDEIRLQIWGAVNAEHSLTIDRNGQINLPKVGVVSLVGVRAGELESVLRSKIGRIFTNFNLNATLGRLRSIQIYVVGQARQPGTYTISSLSTLINALFEVGGPNHNGSMRNIKLKRDGRIVGELDLYKFIAQGDRAGDVTLLPGDAIVIPPAGPRVAVLGAFEQPAIYELKGESNIGDVIELGGGLSVLTTSAKAVLERIEAGAEKARKVREIALDKAGLKIPLRDGDILTLFEISPQFSNAVTLGGNVAAPMRYPFRPGMRVSDLVVNNNFLVPVSYWLRLNAGKTAGRDSRPEVNLDYATLQRLDTKTLRTNIIAFNLSKALLGDRDEDLLLEPGDLLTIYGPDDPGVKTLDSISLEGEVLGGVKRFAWRPGYTVRDVMPSIEWIYERLRLKGDLNVTSYSTPQINLDYATLQRLNPATLRAETFAFNLTKALQGDPVENLRLEQGDRVQIYGAAEPGADTLDSITLRGELMGGLKRFAWRPGFKIKDIIPSADWLVQRHNYWQKPSGKELRNDINWDFAQVIRRVPATLETRALTFNLGRAVLGDNPADNILLEPGDQISLFTTDQMATPVAKRVRLVSVSGEVATPGIYQTSPGETLPQLIERIGGITQDAYVYGMTFTRESVRQQQQKNLDLVISKLEDQLQGDAAVMLANTQDETSAQRHMAIQQQQQQHLVRLKKMRSNGRVSLDLRPNIQDLSKLPPLPLEDGDAILVPTRPGFVSAVGEVFNENALIYREGKTVEDLLAVAGLNSQADQDNAFVMRADGGVTSARDQGRMFNLFGGFESTELMPGDTVVVPAKLDRETSWTKFVLGLKDWTQILYQLGLGAAAWKTLK